MKPPLPRLPAVLVVFIAAMNCARYGLYPPLICGGVHVSWFLEQLYQPGTALQLPLALVLL